MSLLVFGINHKTAPIDIREKVAFSKNAIEQTLQDIVKQTSATEAIIVSTCNRTEIYCKIDNTDEIIDWFVAFHKLPASEIKPFVYRHLDQHCIHHILRVTSGLDSLILGEPQILGQVKDAYRTALKANTLGKDLNRLLQHSFRVAKQVRTDTTIGNSPVSVAFASVSLAKQIFGEINDKTVLLVGAGETIELVARHLFENNIGNVIVANRSLEKAHHLANQYQGYAISLGDIATHLYKADIVISSTASPIPVIGKGVVESALRKRKHRPIFMVDIAVPRDIEPEINKLSDVFLYTVDDLQDVISQNIQSRKEAAIQAEEIIDVQVVNFLDWLESQHSIATIQHYRRNADKIRENLLEKAIDSLKAGKDPAVVAEILAHRLTNQLLHDPCAQLRLSRSDEQKTLLKAAKTLFNIKK